MRNGFIPPWLAVTVAVIAMACITYFGVQAYQRTQVAMSPVSIASTAPTPPETQLPINNTNTSSAVMEIPSPAPSTTVAIASTTNTASSTQTVHFVPPAQPTSTIACGTDMTCFENAAAQCYPATVKWSGNFRTSKYNEAVQAALKIKGFTAAGTCAFTDTITNTSSTGSLPPTAKQPVKGAIISCEFPPAYMAGMITNWQYGSPNTDDLAAGNCVNE